MNARNQGLIAEVLFVGATRPPMRWGVTFSALLLNALFSLELFLLTRNLLCLLIALPIHGVCVLLCARDARFFDLIGVWLRTRLPAIVCNLRHWRASSYSPLSVELPDCRGRRKSALRTLTVPAVTVSAVKRRTPWVA